MTKTENFALLRIFEKLETEGHDFKSYEAFASFAEKTGYKTGFKLYQKDQTKRHGPGNSYWYWKNSDLPDVKSPFCEHCEKQYCPGEGIGCAEYRKRFAEYWNKFIYRAPPKQEKKNREVFRYEHPDLVKEGIEWKGT